MDTSSSSDAASHASSSSIFPLELGVLALAGLVLLAGLFLVSVPSVPSPASDNPLPECRAPTNCERTSRSYAVPADTLFAAAQHALASLDPIAQRHASEALRASAVYRVGGVFKDDMTVVVTAQNDPSTLHVRSASRIGLYDFEVNHRRVRNVLDAVENFLPANAVDGP